MGWAVRGFNPCMNTRFSVLKKPSRPALYPTQSSIKWAPEALAPGLSTSEREAGHLPPSSTMIENDWMYISSPSIFLHGGQYMLLFTIACVKITANSYMLYCSHAAPIRFPCHAMPCHATKSLDCVFPNLFAQCGRAWSTRSMPHPCHATTMPFLKQLFKATAQCSMGMACVN
jgi:hypothetical protein